MAQRYSEVISRTLRRAERRVPTNQEETPLVIEPHTSPSVGFLREFLGHYSSTLLEDLARFGAILLRGFDVETCDDFERHILSIRGMRGMKEILFSEPGRTIVGGTRFVFHTNSLVKTGGTLRFGTFHTENYFFPDVPRYVSFWCQTPSRFGGETGLVNVAELYRDLPTGLKRRLEEKACLVRVYPFSEVGKRYGVSLEAIDRFCRDANLPVATINDSKYVCIYKPSVIQHPGTGERALVINFTALPSLQKPLVTAFLPDYRGSQWLLHRLVWKAPCLAQAGKPKVIAYRFSQWMRRSFKKQCRVRAPSEFGSGIVLQEQFSADDVQMLAKAIRSRYCSFLWKRGDVLIIDNLKIAHNGMAGRGDRTLKVMMCNPIPLPSSGESRGLHILSQSDDCRLCLGAQMARLGDRIAGAGE